MEADLLPPNLRTNKLLKNTIQDLVDAKKNHSSIQKEIDNKNEELRRLQENQHLKEVELNQRLFNTSLLIEQLQEGGEAANQRINDDADIFIEGNDQAAGRRANLREIRISLTVIYCLDPYDQVPEEVMAIILQFTGDWDNQNRGGRR